MSKWSLSHIKINLFTEKDFYSCFQLRPVEGFPGGSVIKKPPTNASETSSVPGLGRSPDEGNDNQLQYSCLENPMEPGGLLSMESRRVGHDLANKQLPAEPINDPGAAFPLQLILFLFAPGHSHAYIGCAWVQDMWFFSNVNTSLVPLAGGKKKKQKTMPSEQGWRQWGSCSMYHF